MALLEEREALKDRIVEAADRLFEIYSYRKTTVEEIAQEAGIGKGSVYLHFASKEEIALAWLAKLHTGLFERFDAIVSSSAPAADRVEALLVDRVLTRFQIFSRHRRSMDDCFSSLRELTRAKREATHLREAELIAGVLREATLSRVPTESECLEAAKSMVLATNALMPYALSPAQLGEELLVREQAAKLASLLVGGFCFQIERGQR